MVQVPRAAVVRLVELAENCKALGYRTARDAVGTAPRERVGDEAFQTERLAGAVVEQAHRILSSTAVDGQQQRMQFAP